MVNAKGEISPVVAVIVIVVVIVAIVGVFLYMESHKGGVVVPAPGVGMQGGPMPSPVAPGAPGAPVVPAAPVAPAAPAAPPP